MNESTFYLKKISASDLDEILALVLWAELEALSIDNPCDKAWIENKLRNLEASGCEFYGCFVCEKLIGFATILVEDRPPVACDGYGACELLQLGILEEYRHKGYGSQTMQALEQLLKSRNIYCFYMHTYASDYTAVAFYGKNGYIPRGVVPDVYGPNLDGMLYMSKALSDDKPHVNP